jgi:hypothetical protein
VPRCRLAWIALPALALACAGCANTRNRPRGLSKLASASPLVNFTALDGDVSFGRPSGWSVATGALPVVAQISSGDAVATIYAYPRTDLPLDVAGAEASRRRLLASLHSRAPSFRVQGSRLREIDGAPAVEIVGRGRIGSHRVRSESVHVYKGAAEYVIDAFSRPGLFRRARGQAFEPMLATMHLGGFPEGPISGGVKAPG